MTPYEQRLQHRAALGVSLTLHASLFASLCILSGREIVKPFSGTAPISVQIITLAQLQAEEHPAPQHESTPQLLPPGLIKQTHLPAPKPAKPASDSSAASKPQQAWSQAQTDSSAATITYQPMPKIPDDLRREAFSTYAMARFHIAADGTSTIELLAPSQNPRLNHILLETLKTWRFTPATDRGKSVASTFDIRVRFAVE